MENKNVNKAVKGFKAFQPGFTCREFQHESGSVDRGKMQQDSFALYEGGSGK